MNYLLSCAELIRLSNNEAIVFKANSKVMNLKEGSNFRYKVSGNLTLGEKSIETNLLFSVKSNESFMYFFRKFFED